MSDELKEIRETLFEIHGMVAKNQQSLDDHLKWAEKTSEKREAQIQAIDGRVGSAEKSIHAWKFIALILGGLVAAPTAVWKIISALADRFGGNAGQ